MKEFLDKNELVSIIVPVYNVEKYLEECLNSIINQTYKNIEIILVDDGSTDNSGNICDDYFKKDNRIKSLHKENGGLSDARNYGLKNIKGSYVCFIDSDDVIDKYFIEKMLYNIKNNNCNISACAFKRFKDSDNILSDKENYINSYSKKSVEEFLIATFYQYKQEIYSVSACNKLYKTEVFDNVEFVKGVLYEDLATIDKIFEKCNSITITEEPLYYYRYNPQSITNSKFTEKKYDVIKHCDNLLNRYKNNKEYFNAIISLKFSKCFEILTLMKLAKYSDKNKEKEIWDFIKKYRKQVLFDKKTRRLNKISAMASYTGKYIAVTINAVRKRIKN